MEEEKKEIETKNNDETEKQETEKSPIEEAKEILAENKKVLEDLREERKKIEKASANLMMSGRGIVGNQIKKEETDEEYSERVRKGSI